MITIQINSVRVYRVNLSSVHIHRIAAHSFECQFSHYVETFVCRKYQKVTRFTIPDVLIRTKFIFKFLIIIQCLGMIVNSPESLEKYPSFTSLFNIKNFSLTKNKVGHKGCCVELTIMVSTHWNARKLKKTYIAQSNNFCQKLQYTVCSILLQYYLPKEHQTNKYTFLYYFLTRLFYFLLLPLKQKLITDHGILKIFIFVPNVDHQASSLKA